MISSNSGPRISSRALGSFSKGSIIVIRWLSKHVSQWYITRTIMGETRQELLESPVLRLQFRWKTERHREVKHGH